MKVGLIISALSSTAAALASASRTTTYFTCRHGFEAALISECERSHQHSTAVCSTPCPGAVRLDVSSDERELGLPDPSYALQILPHSLEVRGSSVKALATAAAAALSDDNELLQGAPRGSLSMFHVLVPDLLRGVPAPKAKLLRRGQAVMESLQDQLRKRYAAARLPAKTSSPDSDAQQQGQPPPPLLLQCLLLEPELLVVSLAQSDRSASDLGCWPARVPMGVTDTGVEGYMPSSAYRKLLESFACIGTQPLPGSRCVDLGACPGGWTAALRKLGCRVTAVDRSPLDKSLMSDEDVDFIQGDAFAFAPSHPPVDWAVSDLIAFPERCVELVSTWTEKRWADRLVFTMKFKGETPDFDAVDEAQRIAQRNGYVTRVKHFFSNKNEVTIMARLLQLDGLGQGE